MASTPASQLRRQVVILGAGRSAKGSAPAAMVSIGERHRVLDWQLASLCAPESSDVHFVGGYRADEIADHYPEIHFHFNPAWETTGPARSLGLVRPAFEANTTVSYSDVLLRQSAVNQLHAVRSDVVIAIDTRWRVRYDGRGASELDSAEKLIRSGDQLVDVGKHIPTDAATAEFAGVLTLSGSTAARLHDDLRSGLFHGTEGVPELIMHLVSRGASVAFVDVDGDWAELNAPQDLARFVLGTKAESLDRLKPLVGRGRIGDLVAFSREEWRSGPASVVKRIREEFAGAELIIRSSAISEDGWMHSAAGAYLSVPDVHGGDEEAIGAAIDRVIASYDGESVQDQVLVQEMLRSVAVSGVVMTRTPAQGAPYYVFNFDSTSTRTDTVTSGSGTALRTLYLLRGAPIRDELPEELRGVLPVIEEIEHLVGHDSLDIEFAVTHDGACHVLQVRPIASVHHDEPLDDLAIHAGIARAVEYHRSLQAPTPFLMGETTFFSVMSDWNPAEMIGVKPNRLAFSLYCHLITDSTWALQRTESGYRDVRPNNLIVDFLGHPYVDLRVDFNSFVPAALPDELAARLVDHYLAELRRRPELHDKVEFDIVFTCFTFDLDHRTERLQEAGFSTDEVALLCRNLVDITRRGISRVDSDLARIDLLERRFDAMAESRLDSLDLAFAMLDDAKRIGIPAFAHLARNAFVAVNMLNSLVETGAVETDDVANFLASIRTVPSAMQEDAARVDRGEMSWDEMVERYGHLRPGSYDLTSPCYASAAREFMGPMLDSHGIEPGRTADASWSAQTRASIESALRSSGLGIDVSGFERFLRAAIEGREFAKFAFMRNLNAALEAIAAFGAGCGASRDDLACIPVEELLALRGARPLEASTNVRRLARIGREEAIITQAVCLPALIFSETDFECFEQRAAIANFVTRKKVRAEIVALSSKHSPSRELTGKIVLIENADPGFDWLFARDIAGLITVYGGVNSHMAIRAAEFRLPAAIGVGDLQFDRLSQANLIELDCASRQIQIVR